MKRKYLVYSVRIFAVVFVIIGMIGVFGEKKYQSVLNNPQGIVVYDKKIYCGIPYEEKINVFDFNGELINVIKVKANGGMFRLKEANGNLLVATVRNEKLYTFNSNGDLIKEENNEKSYDEMGEVNKYKFVDKQNNIYKIKYSMIFPIIQRITPNGQKTTLVSIPLRKWIFIYPIPSWLFCFLGMLLLSPNVADLWRKYKDNESQQ